MELARKILTLVVIYGQYRSFDTSCPSLFEHVVRPNLPAHVVISLDSPVPSFGSSDTPYSNRMTLSYWAQQCILGYEDLTNITFMHVDSSRLLKGRLTSMREFLHMQHALSYIEQHYGSSNSASFPFEYAIKIRTDNYIKADISISTVLGKSTAFPMRFLQFGLEYDRIMVSNNRTAGTFHDKLWAWVFTAGITNYISPMILYPSASPWCLLNATSWNRGLKAYIYSLPQVDINTDYYNYQEDLSSNMRYIHGNFSILYLIGGTWVHFGSYKLVNTMAHDIISEFGKIKYNLTSFDENNLPPQYSLSGLDKDRGKFSQYYWLLNGQWYDVEESQFRVLHMKKGFNLIDIVNMVDYVHSFNAQTNASLPSDVADGNVVVWIHRDCQRHKNRRECLMQANDRRLHMEERAKKMGIEPKTVPIIRIM